MKSATGDEMHTRELCARGARVGHDLVVNRESLDRIVDRVGAAAAAWVELPVAEKARLARAVLQGVVRVAERQAKASLQAKQWPDGLLGEEIVAGPLIVARGLRLLARTLDQIAAAGAPQLPASVGQRPAGQVVVQVLPSDWIDRLLYRGFKAEVWLQPGVTPADVPALMATWYRDGLRQPRVCLVLGAGNVASIAPLDLAYKLFVEGRVCLLKMNPVNEYLGPFIEEAFAPLIQAGFVGVAYGGADVGAYLCAHARVDEIHITGSASTHDAIVFGAGEEGARRKALDEPINLRPVSSELGNVGPVIVASGVWSHGELRFQAENVATQVVNNAGFNCNAARVLVTHAGWAQRGAFLDAIRDALRGLPARRAYYPGAEARLDAVLRAHPRAEQFGVRADGRLPWTLVAGLDPRALDDVCFKTESFCGVLAETSLEASDPGEFVRRAVTWCNETLWGSLNACVIVDPHTERRHADALDAGIAELRYGAVAVNHWPALIYGLGTPTWGAYPGHARADIQSGTGVVHNAYMLSRVEKTVLRGPFAVAPKPLWFATHRRQVDLARRVLRFEAEPSASLVPGLLAAALRG